MDTVSISCIGLEGYAVYMAHEKGDWGPENPDSDYLLNPLTLNKHAGGDKLWIPAPNLEPGEEFKFVVPELSEVLAVKAYNTRMDAGVHVGLRFDYDRKTQAFWLLADGHTVIREGEWNQNNVYTP